MKGKSWIAMSIAAAMTLGNVSIWAAEEAVHMLVNCPRAAVGEQMVQIDAENEEVTPFLAGDTSMIPVRFLAETLGYEVTYQEQTETAVLTGTETIRFQNGSAKYVMNGEEKDMPKAALEQEGRMFVPVRAVCEALKCTVLWNHELISVYPEGAAAALPQTEAIKLAEQLHSGTLPQTDDFMVIGERIIQDIYSTTENPENVLKNWQEDGSFSTIDYQDTNAAGWAPMGHLNHVLAMVKAAYSPGNAYYQDEPLKKKIALALTYWAENDFTCSANTWYTTHGIPTKLADILLFPIEGISEETKQKLHEIVKRGYLVADDPENPYVERRVSSQGGNLTDLILNSLKIAVATQDAAFVETLSALLENELRIFPTEADHELWQENEGIKADYSFWQHNRLPCFGSYGEVFVNGVNKLLLYLDGTGYMVSEVAVNQYTNLIVEGLQWAVVGPYVDYTVNGRSIARQNGTKALQSHLKKACEVLLRLEQNPRKEEIKTLYDTRFAGEDGGITGHKHFWKSDYTVHKGQGYHIGIRATSDRTRPMDRINGENALGYYLGDGTTVFMRTGEEFLNIFPTWDWNKIPGTTTAQNTLPIPDDEAAMFHWFGKTPFAGGVSDGMDGATTLDYKRDGVEAYKSWFMADNMMLALGCGITTDNSNDIVTTVNQTLQNGEYTMNKEAKAAGDFVSGLSWVEHDKIGYIFPEGGNVSIMAQEQTGRWSDIAVLSNKDELLKNDVFTVEIHHGISPENAKYAYLVVMNADAEETQRTAENNPFEILQNDKTIQAVRQSEKQLIQAVFREAGELRIAEGKSISVDRPCILMFREAAGEISVANPYNKQETINVNVNGQTVEITLPGGQNAGQSVTMKME